MVLSICEVSMSSAWRRRFRILVGRDELMRRPQRGLPAGGPLSVQLPNEFLVLGLDCEILCLQRVYSMIVELPSDNLS